MSELVNVISEISGILAKDDGAEDKVRHALKVISESFNATNCTFHRADLGDSFLHMVCQIGLPDHIATMAEKIPVGKGMAGICAERKEPVTMCNLQTDDSGVARPSAKDTKVEGAVVVPLMDEEGNVVATLGVGKAGEYEYSEEEIHSLEGCAKILMGAVAD